MEETDDSDNDDCNSDRSAVVEVKKPKKAAPSKKARTNETEDEDGDAMDVDSQDEETTGKGKGKGKSASGSNTSNNNKTASGSYTSNNNKSASNTYQKVCLNPSSYDPKNLIKHTKILITILKLTQLEHVLKRPDTYIGSIEASQQMMWVFDRKTSAMKYRNITFVPGLYKIFDEILVNAADNKVGCKAFFLLL